MTRWIFSSALIALLTVAARAETQVLIVALGDSTTAGTPGFRSPLEAPPEGEGDPQSQYTYWIMQRHPEWKVLNRGVNAECTDEMLARFERDVIALRPRAVVVLGGVNDVYQRRSAEQVEQNLQQMYERARRAGIEVLACTILPYDLATEAARARMREVNAWIRSAASAQGLGFCDTARVVEDPERPDKLLGSPDGLHPDVGTYRRMGEAIAACLDKLFVSPPRRSEKEEKDS